MRQAQHCRNTPEARHLVAAQRLVKDLFHGKSLAFIHRTSMHPILNARGTATKCWCEIFSSGISKVSA
jgi:hypothetical protein